MFYKVPELSPDRRDVLSGTVYMLAIEVVLMVVGVTTNALFAASILILVLPALILVLALFRLPSGHKAKCAIRWSYIKFAGTARFI